MEKQQGVSNFETMIHDIKKSLRPETHSLEEIRLSLDEAAALETSFIDLLEVHHDFLEESIVVLTDPLGGIEEKQYHLDRFIKVLQMHGIAEQETLYIHLQNNPEKAARLEGLGGQDEHDVAFQICDELDSMEFALAWNEEIDAKAKVVANLVQHHIQEEEREMFPTAKRNIPKEELMAMTPAYLERCKIYLDSSSPYDEGKFTN